MRDARPSGKDGSSESPLLANVLKVAVVLVLVGLLYLDVVRFTGSPSPTVGVELTITQADANWSVVLSALPPGKLPSEMFLLLRNASRDITVPRTSFANLSAANWSRFHVQYEKANAAIVEVQSGDRLLIAIAPHPSGTIIEISDERSILTVDTLT